MLKQCIVCKSVKNITNKGYICHECSITHSWCKVCRKPVAAENFQASSRRCKTCDSTKRRDYQKEYNQRPEVKERNRKRSQEKRDMERGYCLLPVTSELRKINQAANRYGLAESEVVVLLNQTNCSVCGVLFDSNNKVTSRCIDHCHDSGTVRGALCWRCNILLGHIEKGYQLPSLDAFTQYLNR